ncbi:MAG TPA: PAS domain-containing protein [Alphaproteobacteria bacterium]|nr:PAS domain-containing protein [Alphaproteobacteria bacterium]
MSIEELRRAVPEASDAILLLERMTEGFYAIGSDWRFLYVNRSAETFWGKARGELLGQSMLAVFPRFEGSPAHMAHLQAFAGGKPIEAEVTSTATGTPVRLRLFPTEAGLSAFFHDIRQHREMEQELRTRDELLTLAEESAGIGVWVADLKAGTLVATPQFYRLLGIEPMVGPVPQDLPRRFRHPDDRERVTAGFRAALESGADSYEVEYRIVRPDGEERWIFGRGRMTRDASGQPSRYAGIDLDITDRKQQEEHLRKLVRELVHRTSNLLSVVQGLALQSARSSPDFETFLRSFTSRLQGLGQSSALLAREEWRGARLAQLIEAQVAPFADARRFELDGPDALLSPRAVQNLGLAIHELSTNAIKYGALSVPAGRVRVSWRIESGDAGPILHLVWQERGGPRVERPTRRGFGTVLSEEMIASTLGAQVGTTYAPEGIEWSLDLPGEEFSLRPGRGGDDRLQ